MMKIRINYGLEVEAKIKIKVEFKIEAKTELVEIKLKKIQPPLSNSTISLSSYNKWKIIQHITLLNLL